MRARSAVRSLDMAIVVSGAIGPGRMDMIQLAIRMAQELIPPRIVSPDEQLPCGRDRTSPICAQAPRFAPTEIPVLERAPTVTAYLRTHANQPFVLRNYLTSGDHCPPWPAMASWKDPDDLLSRVGQGRHVPVEVGSAYDDDGWTQRIIDFEHFMILSGFFGDRARSVLSLEDQVPHYLAQHSLFRQFPELEDDVVLPDYVWSAPPVPSNFPSYRPPDTANGVIVNVWIGGGGGQVVSPAHTVRGLSRPPCSSLMSSSSGSILQLLRPNSRPEKGLACASRVRASHGHPRRCGYPWVERRRGRFGGTVYGQHLVASDP